MYHVFPAVSGRHLSDRVGQRAARLIAVGGYRVVSVSFLSGVISEPRCDAVQLPGTEWLAFIGDERVEQPGSRPGRATA
jgi:heme/copper-type cytochrome/quinol oxidase subunit 1